MTLMTWYQDSFQLVRDHHQTVGEGEPVETWLSLLPMHPTRMPLWGFRRYITAFDLDWRGKQSEKSEQVDLTRPMPYGYERRPSQALDYPTWERQPRDIHDGGSCTLASHSKVHRQRLGDVAGML
jgi:hypothetical protein